MSVKAAKPSRRYSREQQQEDRSEGQFKALCAELGWPCDRLGRDLGEDLIVRIYDDGASTGLTFQVQLKSTTDSAALTLKRSPALAYPLEVKDLLHWEVSASLVVLVVWDVKRRMGWWRPIPELIRELDDANKGWRKKTTVKVTVPLANGTEGEGMKSLRRAIADHNLPIVPKSDMEFSLMFAKTEEGRAAQQAFERALDTGEPVAFEKGSLPAVEYPTWHNRIYGPAGLGELVKVEVTPTPDTASTAVRVEIESPEGPAAISYVDLRPTKQGRRRLILTNEHQQQPIIFSFVLDSDGAKFTFKQKSWGRSLYEAREVARFMLAAATPGGVIRVILLKDGQTLGSFASARAAVSYDPQEMRRWRDVLDKLAFIQQRVAGCGAVSMDALRTITNDVLNIIDCLFEILHSGKVEVVKSLTFEVSPNSGQLPDVPCTVRVDFKGIQFKILGLDVPLGDVRGTVVDSNRYRAVLRDAQAQANATGKVIPVRLEDMHIIEEYLDWLPGHIPWGPMYEVLDLLAETAAPWDGYFTSAEARGAGASEAIMNALLTEHKIERVAPDIYRLVQLPRSDHEQLLTLWLQTDRRGVLSHDTALFLHELSDILPQRRHITVPPGWDRGDRILDAKVVVYHADVHPDEIRWLGPIPYTAPLRTVRDCIASNLSPDLIEQAIAEGLERGMFTEADLPPLSPRRGAA